jgi:hypothetical protein
MAECFSGHPRRTKALIGLSYRVAAAQKKTTPGEAPGVGVFISFALQIPSNVNKL